MLHASRGIIYVTQERRKFNGKGTELEPMMQIDIPGSWDHTKWNLHIDGCDYLHESLKDAIRQGCDFYDYDPITNSKPGYELREVSKPFLWKIQEPEYYELDKATPYKL